MIRVSTIVAAASLSFGLISGSAAFAQLADPNVGPCPPPVFSGAPQLCIEVTIPPGASNLGPQAYQPNPLVIPQNTRVTWVNKDSVPHTVTGRNTVLEASIPFDSGPIAPGDKYEYTFRRQGSFDYYCSIPGHNMTGTVDVLSPF